MIAVPPSARWAVLVATLISLVMWAGIIAAVVYFT